MMIRSDFFSDETFVRVDKNIDDVIDFDDFLHTDRVYERAMKEEFDMIDTDGLPFCFFVTFI